jgi:hypothetical protein
MTSRKVIVGRPGSRRSTEQIVTTQWLPGPDGEPHEHVTLQTPTPITETQRLRLVKSWELEQEFPS